MQTISTSVTPVSTAGAVAHSITPPVPPETKTKMHPKPKKAEGIALQRYRKIKMRVKYYELKLALMKSLSKGEQFMLDRSRRAMKKFKKIAAPELIQINLKKRASRGKGTRRGSDLAKLMSGKLK